MNEMIIREAAASDIPQMCSIFQKDLGYAECTQEIVEKQFSGLDASREAVFVAEVQGRVAGVIHIEKYAVLYFPSMSSQFDPSNFMSRPNSLACSATAIAMDSLYTKVG